MKKLALISCLAFLVVNVYAEFEEPPPPPAKVYTTVPNYDQNNAAKVRYYGGKKPGSTTCTSGCDAKSEAYRKEYKKYHEYKAAKEFEKYYD